MRKVKKTELDEIGKVFVKAGSVPIREIEEIVANETLFDSVRIRIASESSQPKTRRFRLRPVITAFAGVATIAVVAVFAVVTFKQQPDVAAVPPVSPASPKVGDVKKFPEPDRINQAKLQAVDSTIRTERVTTRPTMKVNRSRTPVAQQVSYGDDFYAVSYAGDPNETERGGRIVRVDIPRSTLFAMGIDLPLENETETVKADLLIGNDGVTRAIRVVK